MEFNADNLRRQIPYYLTAEPAQKELVAALSALIQGASSGYIGSAKEDQNATHFLQGDGWQGFQVFSFNSGGRKNVRGIILSNSCDISSENERVWPPRVIFAPIVKLSKIKARFEDHNLDHQQVASKLQAIKSQSITSIFYIPAEGHLKEEYVVLLDDLHSMPVDIFKKTASKVFTLSMAGFYLFVFKLSVHFCRFHENMDRSAKMTIL